MKKFLASIVVLTLAGCATIDPQTFSPVEPKLIVVLVGGNSESIHRGGLWNLYGGKEKPKSEMIVVRDLAALLKITPEAVSVHYFSWTGDAEGQKGFLPGHWNWITGGSELIRAQVPGLTLPPQHRARLAVVGWSNGGATAYELSCELTKENPSAVSLLGTLDPVAWTTRPCVTNDGKPLRVADNWIDVYTHSTFSERFWFGNIIALFGRAWNDDFPPDKADDLQLLSDSNHEDTESMWTKKVQPSDVLKRWAEQNKHF